MKIISNYLTSNYFRKNPRWEFILRSERIPQNPQTRTALSQSRVNGAWEYEKARRLGAVLLALLLVLLRFDPGPVPKTIVTLINLL